MDCRLVILSPRFNVGLSLVVGSNLGGDSVFTCLILFLVIGYAGSFVYQFILFGINGGVHPFLFSLFL